MRTDMRADRFEDRLLAAILDDFPNLTQTSGAAAGARRRAPFTLGALAAGAAAVALGATGAGLLAGQSHPASAPPSQRAAAGSTHPVSVDSLVKHIQAAVNSGTYVEYVLNHAPDSQTGRPVILASWSAGDAVLSQYLGPDGSPVTGYLLITAAHSTVSITINYLAHTWSTKTYPYGLPLSSKSPGPRPETLAQEVAALRAQVRGGSVKVAGPATVDGQSAIQLIQYPSSGGEFDMWVDPATYLPIRTIATASGISPDSAQAIRADYKWLPATAANLNLLTPAGAIPAGFTQVANAG